MTDADAFLEAIWANPHDDLPRLVYADWLEERGEATYAEFIRVDCFLERREPQPQLDRSRMRRRRHDLRTALAAEWSDAVGRHGNWIMYKHDRGLFCPHPFIAADAFVEISPRWWPRLLVTFVTVFDIEGYEDEVVKAPHASRLKGLCIWGRRGGVNRPLTDHLVRSLATMDSFDKLEYIAFQAVRASRSSLAALKDAPYLPQLGNGGFSARVILDDGTTRDIRNATNDGEPTMSARSAIGRFLDEYGDRVPAG